MNRTYQKRLQPAAAWFLTSFVGIFRPAGRKIPTHSEKSVPCILPEQTRAVPAGHTLGENMTQTAKLGQIIILNGVPRSGKSSIVAAIQETFDGVWMNLGVDRFMQMTPARYQPGIGLRPGGERQDLEPLVSILYSAMYESIAAHSRLGLNVVVDVGHHDAYASPRGILADCARRLSGLPVLFVGVRCPIEVIVERRRSTGWSVESSDDS